MPEEQLKRGSCSGVRRRLSCFIWARWERGCRSFGMRCGLIHGYSLGTQYAVALKM
jgi:hypothetical protein